MLDPATFDRLCEGKGPDFVSALLALDIARSKKKLAWDRYFQNACDRRLDRAVMAERDYDAALKTFREAA